MAKPMPLFPPVTAATLDCTAMILMSCFLGKINQRFVFVDYG